MPTRFLCHKHFDKNKVGSGGIWMQNHARDVADKQTMHCDAKDCEKTLSNGSHHSHFLWVYYRHEKNKARAYGHRVSKKSTTCPEYDGSQYLKKNKNWSVAPKKKR